MPEDLTDALRDARRAEKEHALFYRALAAAAEERGDAALSERLNELHADEQHHLARLTARLLEMEVGLDELSSAPPSPELDGWEAEARRREQGEVARYETMLAGGGADARTAALLREILDTERHHAAELGGKWTAA